MNFEVNDTQRELVDGIIQFSKKAFNTIPPQNDTNGVFNLDGWHKCADMGLMGLPINQEFGGLGADLLTTLLSLEALAHGCKDNGLVFAVVTQMLTGIMLERFGNNRQKEKYLPAICQGSVITAQAITEPNAGSDAMAMKTKVQATNDGYIVNGRKTFISNAPIADLAVIFAIRDSATPKFNRISCLIVEKGCEGFSRSKPFEKIGLRTMQNGELIFDDCCLAFDSLLGKEGQGGMILNEILLFERILFSACHLGAMQRVVDDCTRYANERFQFGQPIGKFQSISHTIANMKVNLEVGKLILYKSAWLKDQKKRPHIETSIAKLFISESLKKMCMEAVQIHGAYGISKEFSIEKELRDSIAATIYSGTSEIHRNIISTLMGL